VRRIWCRTALSASKVGPPGEKNREPKERNEKRRITKRRKSKQTSSRRCRTRVSLALGAGRRRRGRRHRRRHILVVDEVGLGELVRRHALQHRAPRLISTRL